MIPNTVPGVRVSIKRIEQKCNGEQYAWWDVQPVIAWDSDGCPLIAGRSGLRSPNGAWQFCEMMDDPILRMASAQGWSARWRMEDGSFSHEPLIGWGIKASGDVVPLVYADRCATDVSEDENFDGVILGHAEEQSEHQD